MTMVEQPRFNVTPGRSVFRRMKFSSARPRPASFVLRIPDGTWALVVGGEVVRTWVDDEVPAFGGDLDALTRAFSSRSRA